MLSVKQGGIKYHLLSLCYDSTWDWNCYIIKEWCFLKHFSLIIFWHSVWLGFELFGLRVHVHSIGYSLRSRAKDMTITIVIINTQTGNEAGVWMSSCSEEMRWEFGRFWKRFSWVPTMVLRSWGPTMMLRSWCPTMVLRSWSPTMELKVDIGPRRQTIESLLLGHRELSSLPLTHVIGALQISTNTNLKHYKMRNAFVGSYSMVSIEVIEEPNAEVHKPFVPEQPSPSVPAFVFEYVLCICIFTCAVGLILWLWVYNKTRSPGLLANNASMINLQLDIYVHT